MTKDVPGVDRRREDAFARYIRPELAVLYRAALALSGQPADAEDLVQDTLVRAYRALDTFDGQFPRAWLLTIMRRVQMNQHRRRRPDLLQDAATWEQFTADHDPAETSPEDIVVDNMFDSIVEVAFAALPEKQKRVVELVDIDGLTYAETAKLLGIKEGTVMSRLHRARARIRARLAATGFPPRRGGA